MSSELVNLWQPNFVQWYITMNHKLCTKFCALKVKVIAKVKILFLCLSFFLLYEMQESLLLLFNFHAVIQLDCENKYLFMTSSEPLNFCVWPNGVFLCISR